MSRVLVTLGCLVGLAWGTASSEESVPVAPDFDFFVARVAPILEARCASCHADRRKRGRGHVLRPSRGKTARTADHRANYATILKLVEAGNPAGSVWLRSAVGKQQGGLAHGGGGVIDLDSLEFRTMVEFINGRTLPSSAPRPAPAEATLPRVGREGIRLEAEDATLLGDLEAVEDPVARGGRLVKARGEGTMHWTFRTEMEATWRLVFRVRGGESTLAVRIDRGQGGVLRAGRDGFGERGLDVLTIRGRPLDVTTGVLATSEGVLTLGGSPTRWSGFLAPTDVEHDRVETDVFLPEEVEGGDDALLLVGATSLRDASFVGLLDGGRIFALGVLERGRPRIVQSKRLDRHAGGGRHRLGVAWDDRGLRGQLDGRSLVEMPLDEPLEPGRFGVGANGRLRVHALEAFAAWRVYEAVFASAPHVHLPAGLHRIRLDLGPEAPEVDGMALLPPGEADSEEARPEPETPETQDPGGSPPLVPRRRALTAEAVRRFDHDRDGRVSRDEFPGSDERFDAFDLNADGYLDAKEQPKEK